MLEPDAVPPEARLDIANGLASCWKRLGSWAFSVVGVGGLLVELLIVWALLYGELLLY